MKRVLINVEDRELRIAILEDEQLTELYIEPLDDKTILNNIYKGRVEGVLPGLSAAFVNVGFERNAFLHFDDVRPDLLLELQAKREGRPLSLPPPVVEPEEEEEEDQEPQAATAEPSEAIAPVSAVSPTPPGQQGSSRKRRRGRRGGRNRRKRLAEQAAARAAAQTATSVEAAAVSADATDSSLVSQQPMTTPLEPTLDASGIDELPSQLPQERVATASHHQEHSSGKSTPSRQRQQKQRSRQSTQAGRRAGRSVHLPPPDAIRGTRAASNPYDVFTPYALPKKQKSEKKRRRKTAQRPTLDHIIGPTSLPPDVPIEKDSQLDFFGPAQPSTSYSDEPFEEPSHGTPQGHAAEGDFLDEANGNAQPSGQDPEVTRKKKTGPRRSMRRKNSAPYAVRRSKKAAASDGDSAEEQSQTTEKKSVRRRSSVKAPAPFLATEPVETAPPSDASPSPTQDVSAVPQASEAKEQKPARRTSRRKKTEAASEGGAAELMTDASPDEQEAARDVQVAEVQPATTSRVRTRKKAAAAAAEENVSAEEASRAPVAPTAEAPAARRASTKTTRRKKAAADEPSAPAGEESQPPAEQIAEPMGGAAASVEMTQERSATLSKEDKSPVCAPTETLDEYVPDADRERGEISEQVSEAANEPASVTTQIVTRGPEAAPAVTALATQRVEVAAETLTASNPSDTVSQEIAPSSDIEAPAEQQPQELMEDEAALAPTPVAPPTESRPTPQQWKRPRIPKVQEAMRKGDEILVQVTKEEIGGKGARITTYISLPGRYLVLLPYGTHEGGVSRRVENYEERRRLKRLQRKLRHDLGIQHMGLIIRTAGVDRSEEELRKDAEFLIQEWRKVEEKAAKTSAPALLYDDSDILYRLCRDVFDESIDEIIIDNADCADKIRSILHSMIPELESRVKLYENPINLFVQYGVDEKIRKAGRRKVWLKSGGYIIIDEAEALTAIDVNTGKFVGKDSQEQMILKTNLEAAQVIARELKLRDIGGLIVIDFIDMRDPRNRETLLNEFRALLHKDHAKSSVSGISEFGLVEMTRKRVRQSLRRTIFTECPYCKGSGVVFTEQQIWIHLKNAVIEQLEKTFPKPDLVVHVNPTIKEFVEANYAETLQRIGQRYGVQISLAGSDRLHVENYEIEKRRREGNALDTLIEGVGPGVSEASMN